MVKYVDFTELNILGEYLIKLLSSVLHEQKAPAIPEEITWAKVYEFGKMHGVEAMAFYGALPYIKEQTELYEAWKRSRDQNLIQALTQEAEKEALFRELSRRGVDFLPLKGCKMRTLYCQAEFRQMSDLDILVKPDRMLQVSEIMESLGYEMQEMGEKHHDEYFKEPYVTAEIHRQLVPMDSPGEYYYRNVWERLLPDSEIQGEFRFTPEDFYIHQIVHFASHFETRGSGIRSLMDIYVYLSAFGSSLNREYILRELDELKLTRFCEEMETLSFKWFGVDMNVCRLTEKRENELRREIFASGTYGTWEAMSMQRMKNCTDESNRTESVKYVLTRIFMSKKELSYSYPILRQYGFMLPFCWLRRAFHILIYKRDSVKKEAALFRLKKKGGDF